MSTRSPPAAAAVRAFYGKDVKTVTAESDDDLREILRQARRSGETIIPSGLGNHAYLGNLPPERPIVVVSMKKFSRILRYEPADFTVGVEAGVPLDRLRKQLAANRQEIAVDFPPAPKGTIGGAVATDRDGPRRGRYGSYRNMIIGIDGMRGDGMRYRAGGMVVKNVAGYDVGKIHVGALGTLGFLLEINFKLRPIPKTRRGDLVLFSSAGEAWEFAWGLYRERLEPALLSVLDPEATGLLGSRVGAEVGRWSVVWVFEGNVATVEALSSSTGDRLAEVAAGERLPLDPQACEKVIDGLSILAEPERPGRKDLLILRVAALPGSARGIQAKILEIVTGADAESAGCRADVSTGVLVLRITGKADALKRLAPLLRAVAVESGVQGRLLFASREVRESEPHLLVPDPNRRLAHGIHKVFDPTGVFHTGRILPP